MIIRIALICTGVLLILLSGRIEPLLNGIGKNLILIKPGSVSTEVPDLSLSAEEDDILNNKTKWRIILAGYIIFGIISIFSLISVFTLNQKINTLYNSVRNMEERVSLQEEPGSGH